MQGESAGRIRQATAMTGIKERESTDNVRKIESDVFGERERESVQVHDVAYWHLSDCSLPFTVLMNSRRDKWTEKHDDHLKKQTGDKWGEKHAVLGR